MFTRSQKLRPHEQQILSWEKSKDGAIILLLILKCFAHFHSNLFSTKTSKVDSLCCFTMAYIPWTQIKRQYVCWKNRHLSSLILSHHNLQNDWERKSNCRSFKYFLITTKIFFQNFFMCFHIIILFKIDLIYGYIYIKEMMIRFSRRIKVLM